MERRMKWGFFVLFLVLSALRRIPGEDFFVNCSSPLGMQSKAIPDRSLMASSAFGGDFATYGPQKARLHFSEQPPGYRADRRSGNTSSPPANETWVMVLLPNDTIITGISTQGYGGVKEAEWVIKYSLMFSIGSEFFHFRDTSGAIKNFTGNNDSSTVMHHDVPLPVITSSVMLRPLEWNNNVGLRMELYGCAPGYYFLALLEIRGEVFTLPLVDDTSEYHRTWVADTTHEVRRLLEKTPGFLAVQFKRFRLSRFEESTPLVTAEVEIHCIKEAANFTAERFKELIDTSDSMFSSNPEIFFPTNSNCSFPDVSIHLNETTNRAKKVLTTTSLAVRADATFCSSKPEMVAPLLWEMSIVFDGVITPFLQIGNGTEHVLDPRSVCLDCFPVFVYLRFTSKVHQFPELQLQAFGLLEIVRPPLIAKINGAKNVTKRIGKVVLNASESFDPDRESPGILNFTWSCKRGKELAFHGNCPHVRRLSEGRILLVDVTRLKSKHSYDFKLLLTKGRRETVVTHQLKVSPAVIFFLSCVSNCGKKITQSKGLRIRPECEGDLCKSISQTNWDVFMQNQSESGQWDRIKSLTTRATRGFLLGGQLLPQQVQGRRDVSYKLKATIEIHIRNDMITEEHELEFIRNSAPNVTNSSGGCFVEPPEGYALTTSFEIFCIGWWDEDQPLRYEFRYSTEGSGLVINHPNAGVSTLITSLPVGDEAHGYDLPVHINILDSLGDFAVRTVKVKVRDKGTLDVVETLQRIANREDNKYSQYIKFGEPEKACAIAISVLSLAKQRKRSNDSWGGTERGNKISKEEARKLKGNIIDELMQIKINSKELITKVSIVVAMATKERDEISQASQENAVYLLEEATDFLAVILANDTEDGNTMKAVSSNLLLGLGNILKISSEDASVTNLPEDAIEEQTDVYNVDKEASKSIARKTVRAVWKLRDYLTVSSTDYDPVVIVSRFISFVLYNPFNLGPPEREQTTKIEIKAENATTNLTLPSFDALFSKKRLHKNDISSKIVVFNINPYTWHKSSSAVKSWVVDVVLQAPNKTNFRITGLDDPIQLYLPQNPALTSPEAVENSTSYYFLKPSYEKDEPKLIQYHKINLPHDKAVAFVRIKPEISASVRVYVAFADYPTPRENNLTTILPDFSTCQSSSDANGGPQCKVDPFTFSFTSSETGNIGTHYIGIHYYIDRTYPNDASLANETGNDGSSSSKGFPKDRRRRSCGGSTGRQKRSCIGVKDPPPPLTPAPTVLKSDYNASTDLNYTLTVTVGSCLYWSEEKESWTNDGCKVSPDITTSSVKCLCNHLSAFGGEFFVAPNEIDFQMAFNKFAEVEETKNFLVLTTVCSILALYVVGLVFTRRSDKKDKTKAIPNVYLPDGGYHGEHNYQISVQTGLWVGSGTTANVGLIMYGEDGYSDSIILTDITYDRKFFARGSVNNFEVSLPRSLGPLFKVRVWHDNSGESPGWFLQDVVVTEVRSQQKWHFIANRWLAVEKVDRQVDVEITTSNTKEASRFKNLFYSRASKKLADGHLWVSVFARSPQSSFTRTQRLSCCLSVLFLAMVTNAMFYHFGEEPKDKFQVGPLSMSLTQVKIGIQSALIALPVNILIVTIFRNIKPRRSMSASQLGPAAQTKEDTSRGLPPFFVYIAWILCILVILSAAFFTVLYSMSWGTNISNEWLASILVSFIQDVVVLQPIEVLLIASFLSVLIRQPIKHDPVYGSPRQKTPCAEDYKVQPPEETELNTSRRFRMKLQKMLRSVIVISLFLVFILLLFVVCYGNRSTDRYRLTQSIKNVFATFDKRVNTTAGFWNWTRNKLVPGLFLYEWYNGEPVKSEEGFLSTGYPFLVGMPRLRQLRVRPGPCQVTDIVEVDRCMPFYSYFAEDRTPYNFRGWTPIDNVSAFDASFRLDDVCPKPWRYRIAEDLLSLPFKGYYAVYDGGGYVADLGYNAESALGVIDDLEQNKWIDDKTFAVFIEFTVFEPASTLFSAAKYLYERYPTGGTKTTSTIETLMIYYPTDPDFSSFYQVCQLLLLILIFVLFIVEIVKLYHQGCSYFLHFWYIVEFFQISSAVGAMVLYFFKAKYTSDFVRKVRANPFQTSSSDYVVLWSDVEVCLLSFVVFIVTIKSLRLLKFNRHVCHLTHTLKTATMHLISYSVVFAATLIAYSQLGTLLFGSRVDSYSNLLKSLRTLLQRLLGAKMYTVELQALNEVLAQVFTFAYSVSMVMILFNMFMSILNSSYSNVRLAKQGCFADVELAAFSLQYLKEKTESLWNDFRDSINNARRKPWTFIRGARGKYFKVPSAVESSDILFSTKHISSKPDFNVHLSEEYRCPSLEELQFQEASFESLDDIDFVDEYSSLRDVKKSLVEIGTAFFLSKSEWNSTNLDNDEDDREDASSLSSQQSFGVGSNPSYISLSELSFGMDGNDENCVIELGNCSCMEEPFPDSNRPDWWTKGDAENNHNFK